ncbi:ttbk1 protein [Burkholderia pseudomallei 576]|nr:ttbk1 protein [Burkholderia pseudomallei 576]
MISRGSPSPSQAARCCMHRAMLHAFAQPAADQSPRSDKPG